MRKTIDYPQLIEDAMRRVVASTLKIVEKDGLPGAHHFFLAFDTQHPDVNVSEWIKSTYPETMTIVMQHWFANLEVGDEGFSVTLNFNDKPEPLYIPFAAILQFEDPSCEMKIGFRPSRKIAPPSQEESNADETEPESEPASDADGGSVVQLDRFR